MDSRWNGNVQKQIECTKGTHNNDEQYMGLNKIIYEFKCKRKLERATHCAAPLSTWRAAYSHPPSRIHLPCACVMV